MHRVSDESSFRGKSSVLGSSSERCASSMSCDCREKRAGGNISNDTLIIKVYLLKNLSLPFVIFLEIYVSVRSINLIKLK